MALTKIRLGDYIEQSTANNHSLEYGMELIVGVSSEGVFTAPKGNPNGVNLLPYKIVNNGAFVYNPTRLDLGSIAYRTEGLCIVSHLYIIFYLNEEGRKIIDPMYLLLYFRRAEFRREVRFRNFGSQRPEFGFSDMSDIVVPLPPLEIQQKYAAIYTALLANQKSYESGLEDLKLVLDASMDRLKRETPCMRLGDIFEETNERNRDGQLDEVMGVTADKRFVPSNAVGADLTKYKIVRCGDFACNFMHVGRDWVLPVALNLERDFLISPAYSIFKNKSGKVLNEFLMIWLSRSETDRNTGYLCDGSIRGNLDLESFYDMSVPVPDKSVQKSLVDLYKVYVGRKGMGEKLKEMLKGICPILIKGSLEEAAR